MQFIGVVMAGGASRRMGTDKAELEWSGQTLLKRTQNLLKEAGANKVIVSGTRKNTPSIPDIHPNIGPLGGMHAVLKAFGEHNLLFVPVDLPLLSASSLRTMVDKAQASDSNVRFKDHNLPLLLRQTTNSLDTLEQILEAGENYSIKYFCQCLGIVDISITNEKELLNSNTQKDWQMAQQYLEKYRLKKSTRNNVII